MYGLPKIHKSGIPLRPILSLCHSAQHALTKWLIQLLNPVLKFYSGFCDNDSFSFSSIIHQLTPYVKSQFLVSFDIASLFTNVPLDEVISTCADFLYRSPLTSVLSFPENVFVELMELVTKSVSFSFNGTMYCQVNHISMGSPLALHPLIFLSGFMRDSFLIGSLSPTSIYITLMTHLLVLVYVTKVCCSSIA